AEQAVRGLFKDGGAHMLGENGVVAREEGLLVSYVRALSSRNEIHRIRNHACDLCLVFRLDGSLQFSVRGARSRGGLRTLQIDGRSFALFVYGRISRR